MKGFICIIVFVFSASLLHAQVKVGENRTTIQPGSLLELESTGKGFLNVRMSTAEMLSVPVSAASRGMMVYNTDSLCLCVYNGTNWKNMCKGQSSIQQKATYTANAGDAVFATPQVVRDEQDIQVFRNGVQVNFTATPGSSFITLEAAAICKKDDEIKIIQFVNP
ncbi:MAG: hypothetical protein JNL13_07280 [Chitinophagaceae bacterium]|nr:hypothetical protein [Chitinophagaceae bacterium]